MEKLDYFDDKISYLEFFDGYDKGQLYWDEETEEYYEAPTGREHGFRFPIRFNDNKIESPKTYKEYLNDLNIQEGVKALGLDVEKFWFFILYAYDLSRDRTKYIIPIKNNGGKEQFRNFIDAIDSAFINEGKETPKQIKDVRIEIFIDNKKQKASIDNKYALVMLSSLMDNFLDEVENNSTFDSKQYAGWKESTNLESTTLRNFLFISYFKMLFEYLKKDLKQGRRKACNKNDFISDILAFMCLVEDRSDKDYVKHTYKYYKDKELNLSFFGEYV